MNTLTARSYLLLVVVISLALLSLVACSRSSEEANPPQAPAAQKPAPNPTANPPVAGNQSPPVAPPAAKPGASAPPVAQPKKVVAAPQVAADAKGPRIALKTEEVDFGEVNFGDVAGYTFLFTNVGNEALKVSKVQIETLEGC